MIKLFALAAAVTLVTGCSSLDAGGTEAARRAAARHDRAAFLGYHGPVERMAAQYRH